MLCPGIEELYHGVYSLMKLRPEVPGDDRCSGDW